MSVCVLRNLAQAIARCQPSSLIKFSPMGQQQVAGITNKHLQALDKTKPVPYPYQTQGYGGLRSVIDKTSWRLDENSKVIVVDGPVDAGKHKFAEELAERLNMVYMPHAHLDRWYINQYGFDLRKIDPHLRNPKLKSFDIEHFLENPFDDRATIMQFRYMEIRIWQYLDTLAHVLNTGQGVVLNRSIWSDFVFVETMTDHGMLTNRVRDYYYNNVYITYPHLKRPHVIIYLDLPVDEVINRIKKKGVESEIKSPFYQPQILQTFESIYKDNFLADNRGHSEILIYDATKDIDMEEVVEDCERLNLDDYFIHHEKMSDWRHFYEEDWNFDRAKYTNFRSHIENKLMRELVCEILEYHIPGEDMAQYHQLVARCPGYVFQPGYNEDVGDTGLLFKVNRQLLKFGRQGIERTMGVQQW